MDHGPMLLLQSARPAVPEQRQPAVQRAATAPACNTISSNTQNTKRKTYCAGTQAYHQALMAALLNHKPPMHPCLLEPESFTTHHCQHCAATCNLACKHCPDCTQQRQRRHQVPSGAKHGQRRQLSALSR